jgi:hypothetical protein
LKHLGVQFGFPQHLERLPLRVIIEAGEANEGGIALCGWSDDLFNEILSLADAGDLSGQLWGWSHHRTSGDSSAGVGIPPGGRWEV